MEESEDIVIVALDGNEAGKNNPGIILMLIVKRPRNATISDVRNTHLVSKFIPWTQMK